MNKTPIPAGSATSRRKHPLKVNVFERLQSHVSQLTPLFPYLDDGAIVPATALFVGREGFRPGRFSHFNTVEEVALVLAAAGGYVEGASLRVTNRTHAVTAPLVDPADPEAFVVTVITQRNNAEPSQPEAIMFMCPKCNKLMARYDYDAKLDGRTLGPVPEFSTVYHSFRVAEAFNADPGARTCKHCGHVEPPFPVEEWGWGHYTRHTEVVNRARQQLETMSAEVLDESVPSEQRR
ncbi:MAG TPA: hypothetical protein VGX03_15920 [Candidatus Binatia bacterium]|jgi:hypothetical protein|nr:hypothetical protein [Candidatus Binatia bacterium]